MAATYKPLEQTIEDITYNAMKLTFPDIEKRIKICETAGNICLFYEGQTNDLYIGYGYNLDLSKRSYDSLLLKIKNGKATAEVKHNKYKQELKAEGIEKNIGWVVCKLISP
jgi:hypothetical protein